MKDASLDARLFVLDRIDQVLTVECRKCVSNSNFKRLLIVDKLIETKYRQTEQFFLISRMYNLDGKGTKNGNKQKCSTRHR